MHSTTGVFVKPVFSRGISILLHIVLLVSLIASFASQRYGECRTGRRCSQRKKSSRGRKLAVLCSFGISAFNLVLIFFYWYKNGMMEDGAVTMLDLSFKSVSWAALGVYLRSDDDQFPVVLTAWWGFYLCVSCYSMAVDIFSFGEHSFYGVFLTISDGGCVLTALVVCGISFLKCAPDATGSNLDEPLLNGDKEKTKSSGCDTVTPFANCGFISILTFSWLSPLIGFGYKKTLDLEDLPQLYSGDSVAGVFPVFNSRLESRCASADDVSTWKLTMAILSTIWKEVLLTGTLAFVYCAASYVGPYLIDSFVLYLDGEGGSRNQGYLLASAFFAAKVVECLSQRHWFFRLQQIGIRMRAVLVAKIYRKSLTLSSASKQDQTSGQIINIMAVDAERVSDFCWYMHDGWLVLVQVSFALVVLYKNLGLATVATFAATLIVMLLNYPLGRLQTRFQEKLMEAKDERMKATSEILRNMRILKLQAWEMKFLSKVFGYRKKEEGWLKKYVYNTAVVSFIFWGAPTLVALSTFGTCVLLKIPLESGKILSALATFRVLQEPIYNLPDSISMMIQTKVSLDRIAAFLRLPDIETDTLEKLPRGSSETVLDIADGNFSWESSSSNLTLKDLNLKVRQGMHVAVCGTVGSGKSSLLSCILGELPRISGNLKICGTKAYVAQSPWIQSGTIEANILFGKEMDREKYDRILEACCLNKDMEIFAFGDQTLIGERGINLSGGQKQRIQISRALYQDADIYLFDDPFSAVDAHTGTHLFKEVLCGILSSKTVIYVTHQVEFLPAADLILVMKDGRVTQRGKYDELLSLGSHFMELVGAHEAALSAIDSKQIDTSHPNIGNSSDSGDIVEDGNSEPRRSKEEKTEDRQLVEEEEREKGRIGFQVYWKYLRTAYGGALVPVILLIQIIFQALQIASNYWMAWASPVSKDAEPNVKTSTLLIVFAILSAGSALCILCRSFLTVTAGYKTATILFEKMHYSIFRAPMSFFDATPGGRILNRASTDQSAIDLRLPYQISYTAFSFIILLGIIAVMSQVAWQVFLLFIPVVAICIWYQQYYLPSAIEFSRLVGVCKAPVIQNFTETISGTTTIRGFDQQLRFVDLNMKLTDAYSRPKFHIAAAMEWLCFRLDIFSSVTFAFTLFFLVIFPSGINPAVAGLAVTYGLNLNTIQAWVIWNVCNLENNIISVERVLQYISIASEPPLVIEEKRPDTSWPSLGEILLDDLQVRYAPHLPLVLRGISCTILGGKKTGIVGRTGSGKSTLIQAFFRIVEPSSGRIAIDGVDITSIGVHDLRSRLSIIPQDPTMFEGTVRTNLDPLEEYSDTEIWEALDKCQLGDEVRKSELKLDAAVTENGENWSMGQRQLVCLGRVLLKKTKVLVLDEATASVDTFTDNLIQHTLKLHFRDCTVITIAHRITSVLDSDAVLLLSHGLVEEFDAPAKLLANKSSSFSRLVAEYRSRSSSSSEGGVDFNNL